MLSATIARRCRENLRSHISDRVPAPTIRSGGRSVDCAEEDEPAREARPAASAIDQAAVGRLKAR